MMQFIPLTLIGFCAFFSKKATNSWLSPGSFFSIMWFFFVGVPIIFSPGYEIYTEGLWFISLFVMACSTGSIFTLFFFKKSKIAVEEKYGSSLNEFLHFFNILSFLGILFLLFFIKDNYQLKDNLSDWLLVPNLISIDRYGGDLKYPSLVKYLLYFIYPSSIIAGLTIGRIQNLKIKIYNFLPILFGFLIGMIEGSRTSILLCSVLFFSSWLGFVASNENVYRRSFLMISMTRVIIFILFFIVIFILIQWFRQGLDPFIFELLIERLYAYFFGYISAFTMWFNSIESVFLINTTLNTFAGPMNLMGFIERDLGFYEPVIIKREVSTNIFTALRSLITDFSIFGSIIISFLTGMLLQLHFLKPGKNIILNMIFKSIFYSYTIYSPLISVFHYNSIFFSWIIVYIISKIDIKK